MKTLSMRTARWPFKPLLQARLGRHRFETEGLVLPLRPLARLAQDEESGSARGEAGGRGGLGAERSLMRPGTLTSDSHAWNCAAIRRCRPRPMFAKFPARLVRGVALLRGMSRLPRARNRAGMLLPGLPTHYPACPALGHTGTSGSQSRGRREITAAIRRRRAAVGHCTPPPAPSPWR